MLEYEYATVINRPLEEVFDYMQDISREYEWQPNLREAEQIPEGTPGVGTKRRYVSEFMGHRFENIYVNTIYEPYRRVAYTTAPESDTRATGEVVWEAVEGGTRVTMRVEADVGGVFKLVPKGIITSVGKKELADSLARLKALLEGSA